jgi:GPH family glycoside/pentoside/hexuronide:cation symporter
MRHLATLLAGRRARRGARERHAMEASETTAAGTASHSLRHKLIYALGNLPSGLTSGVMGAWLMFYYCPPADSGRTGFVSPETFGLWLLILSVPSALADPTVGHLSDGTRSRLGRRIPYILYGTPILALSFIMMWFPPTQGISTANTIWLIASVLIYYLSFTAVVNPLLAIMPEIWTTEGDRMSVSALMSVAGAIGTLLSSAAGVLIEAMPGTTTILGIGVNGFRLTAILCGVFTILSTAPTVLWIRETPHSASKEVPYSILRSGWQTLKNPAFLPYLISVALINTSTTMVVALLPYQVTVLAKSTEGAAGALMAILMVVAMLFLPLVNKLIEKIPRRRLYLASCLGMGVILCFMYFIADVPGRDWSLFGIAVPARLVFMCALLLLAAPFVSVFLVVPRTLLADVMDYDEQLTGYRREAMYNGMESLIGKIPTGFAPLIMGTLFQHFGNTADRTGGILYSAIAGGVLTVLSWAAFLKYPLRK